MSTHRIWTPGMSLEAVERETILSAFSHHRGNKTATANDLKIGVRTLDAKLEKYAAEDKKAGTNAEERKKANDAWLRRCRGEQPISQAGPANGDGSSVEPPPVIPARSTMSVQEREDVPPVLPRSASASDSRRSRRNA